MQEEVDLHVYVQALVKRWYWIVGLGLLFGIIALVASTLATPKYEASALVAFLEPRQRLQFDVRFQTSTEKQSVESFPEVALSDQTLLELQSALPSAVASMSLSNLRDQLSAAPGNDPSFIRLTAEFEDPDLAADVVNEWAALFVARANAIFGSQGGEALTFFQEQLDVSKQRLDAAEQELITFQSENRAALLTGEWNALLLEQADLLETHSTLQLLRQDVAFLQEQVASQDVATFADQFTALGLQVKAFNLLPEESNLQLQVGTDVELTSANRADQLAYLDNLQASIDAKLAELAQRLSDLEQEILQVQEEKQSYVAEEERLVRDRDVAKETYISVARKVDEERISSGDVTTGIRLVSTAAVPVNPSSPRPLLNTAVATLVGAMLGIFVALALEWWQVGRQR